MGVPRISADARGLEDLVYDSEVKEKFDEIFASTLYVALEQTFADRGEEIPFSRDSLNITVHMHDSTERTSCTWCYDVQARDEIN